MTQLENAIRSLVGGTASQTESRLIFCDFYPRVLRFFRRKGYGQEEAEDHAQEALTRVFQRATSCRDPRRFRSWVFAIASNLYRNELRDEQAERRQGEEIGLDDPTIAGASKAITAEQVVSPEQAALSTEFRKALSVCVATLPPKRRRAIMMSYEGYPHDEIARELGISVGTVKAHVHQARQALKTSLVRYFNQDKLKGSKL